MKDFSDRFQIFSLKETVHLAPNDFSEQNTLVLFFIAPLEVQNQTALLFVPLVGLDVSEIGPE